MNKTYIATMGERFFMSKIAIATDSNSGITQAQGRELGIFVMPMPFYINDELFLEDITLSQEQFYQRLEEGADVKTTQPAPGDVLELWDRILKDYDELVYIPMSSGLSSSCETAVMLAQDYGGRVQVVNNQRISVTLRQSALDAQALAAAGRSAAEIKALLEQTKFDSDIYITVDTLKYLKKGGRCTPAAAAIGTVLNLKPVLRIKGEKLDSFAKARGLEGRQEDHAGHRPQGDGDRLCRLPRAGGSSHRRRLHRNAGGGPGVAGGAGGGLSRLPHPHGPPLPLRGLPHRPRRPGGHPDQGPPHLSLPNRAAGIAGGFCYANA